MLKNSKKAIQLSLCAAAILGGIAMLSGPSFAQDVVNVAPAEPTAELDIPISTAKDQNFDDQIITHAPLRLTPDKSEIIRLKSKVGSIILGNPAHLNILPDSATTLIIVPRAPGASFFTILDENGDVIMQRHAIVAAQKEKYVRIRRTCGGDEDCQPTSVYYCPDMCHEIQVSGETKSGSGNDLADALADAIENGPANSQQNNAAPLEPATLDTNE